MKYKISVIIPVYNGQQSILQTIDSIINQSFPDVQVIVVNDGSTDETESKVKDYIKTHENIILVSQKNSGVSSARNKGISISEGSYISFLDADDTQESTYLTKMYEKINTSKSDVVYCGYNIKIQESVNAKNFKFTNRDLLNKYLLGKVSIASTCWLIDRDLIFKNHIRFPEDLSWSEDVEFFSKILGLTKKVSFVDEYLVNYHVSTKEDSLSSFDIKKMDYDYKSIMRMSERTEYKSTKLKRSLIDYRLNALLTFRFYEGMNRKIPYDIMNEYYDKYKGIIQLFSWSNGLRSIKLNLVTIKIRNKFKKVQIDNLGETKNEK